MKGFFFALLLAGGMIGAAASLGLVDIRYGGSSARPSDRAEDSRSLDDTDYRLPAGPDADDTAAASDSEDDGLSDEDADRAKRTLREIRVKDRDEQ